MVSLAKKVKFLKTCKKDTLVLFFSKNRFKKHLKLGKGQVFEIVIIAIITPNAKAIGFAKWRVWLKK